MPLTNPSEVTVLSASVTLTDAQIKALPTTPIVIVPATEVLNYSGLPSQIPLPISFSVSLDPSGGGYTNLDNPVAYILALGSDWSSDGMSVDVGLMAQLADATPQIGICNSYDDGIVSDQIKPLRINSNGLQDNALAIAIRNGSLGNLTGGHASNSMKVTVLYTIMEV